MKTIGLLGGMSWESSVLYEQIINQEVRARLGGVHSASLLIRSYDFAQIERLQAAGDWQQAGHLLAADAARLQDAGAQILVLATNTMHQVYDQIAAAVSIPFPHIADATGTAIRAAGLSRIGLLGTRFTMERGFYRDRLAATYHLKVLVPAEADRALVHQVIYSELVQGVISDASRQHYLEIIRRLTEQGAEGVIAGCTEIELLVTGDDTGLPYFPTTRLHAQAAVDLALARHADLLLLSGIFLPLTLGPAWRQGIARISSFKYVIGAMRQAYYGQYFNTIVVEGLAVAVGLAVVCLWLGCRVFLRENA